MGQDEFGRNSRFLSRRYRLHSRDLQERRQDDIREGSVVERPFLFNAGLEGNVRRAIDIHEGDKVNEAALKNLIRAAVVLNLEGKNKPKGKPTAQSRKKKKS